MPVPSTRISCSVDSFSELSVISRAPDKRPDICGMKEIARLHVPYAASVSLVLHIPDVELRRKLLEFIDSSENVSAVLPLLIKYVVKGLSPLVDVTGVDAKTFEVG